MPSLRQRIRAFTNPQWRHHQEFSNMRGDVVGLWAGIESAVDKANHAAVALTRREISSVVPQSYRWKVQLFEQLHRDLLPFTELSEEGRVIYQRLASRVQDRHFLVHGYNVPDDDREGWTLRRHEFRKDGGLDTAERRFSRSELESLRRDLIDLSNECARYIHALEKKLAQHLADDERR